MTVVRTTVIRHPKERISKCSLRFLHDRPEMTFLRGKPDLRFDATGFILLAVDAPPVSLADQGRALLLLDSTWRWLPQLNACVTGEPIKRSIPGDLRTAYPRVSKTFEDPAGGLASIEALYVARKLLGDEDPELLHGYHWKDEFLTIVQNAGL
ncbi:MAG: pre-rRNA-processing protein TSR3 [Planctomycetota bacterium]